MNNQGKIFITSDTHFCHDKDFVYQPRGFSSVHEMNEEIVKRWNSVVSPIDTVYHLGDVMLNDDIEGCNCIRRLNGQIYIIAGNHCTANRWQKYANIRHDIIPLGLATIIKYRGYRFYLSHYPTITSNYDVDKPLKTRVISLAGHSHTKDRFKDMDKGLIYHCELDAHNCYPVSLDDIITDIINYTKGELNESK